MIIIILIIATATTTIIIQYAFPSHLVQLAHVIAINAAHCLNLHHVMRRVKFDVSRKKQHDTTHLFCCIAADGHVHVLKEEMVAISSRQLGEGEDSETTRLQMQANDKHHLVLKGWRCQSAAEYYAISTAEPRKSTMHEDLHHPQQMLTGPASAAWCIAGKTRGREGMGRRIAHDTHVYTCAAAR
jgi:hypothetical protein